VQLPRAIVDLLYFVCGTGTNYIGVSVLKGCDMEGARSRTAPSTQRETSSSDSDTFNDDPRFQVFVADVINEILRSRGYTTVPPGEQAVTSASQSNMEKPRNKLAFRPKDDDLAEKVFQKALQVINKDRNIALMCLNEAIRFGTFKLGAFEKRAKLLFLEKRFYECIRDVDLVLASPSDNATELVAMKCKSLLNLGCPTMALSFLKIASKCLKNADFSKNGMLDRLKKTAKRKAREGAADVDEQGELRSSFPDREEMLRRVKRWTPADGKKIGAATVSGALALRPKRGKLNFVAVRNIEAGMYDVSSMTVARAVARG
jgi:hypothetical protein